MKARIATFNCENLFARFQFRNNTPEEASENGFTINDVKFDFFDPVKRRLTANAIKAIKADVIALQEVENLDVLKRFRSQFLGGFRSFPHVMLIDGNDPRFIDVAILSKYPIIHARSYIHRKKSPSSRSFIFSRDCLEADIDFDGTIVTLYVNHFKSLIGGRSQTKKRRLDQVQAVRQIISDRFGTVNPGEEAFIILGDLNDYIEEGRENESSLTDLVLWDEVENVVENLDPEDQWTHYFHPRREYRQLDYILVSKSLTSKVTDVEIERQGMPRRAERYEGPRFRGVGVDNPKSSDHCPIVVELDL